MWPSTGTYPTRQRERPVRGPPLAERIHMAETDNAQPDNDGRTAPDRVSRRTLMKVGAGTGIAAAVAITTTGIASAEHAPAPQTVGSNGPATHDGPLIVNITNASAGTAEIFTSSTKKQIKDRDLVARILRAARD
jgi:hypothetical protein